ncbi:hypothetical protein FA10DRAFT_262370 [Acaromyces ingoldii]|uniref:PAS domain-containing protein n=1 Tax=Acaromyces ingoldii TaxID=215250 RepID=A0A316YFF5_9BASI|nr:hypothetical protein FA10DRAFT_262370 [Acaromyces ingoldii]PWN87939.1 hypothetical protein FA10DRAFT_262370 [Acaromyces ingoldii]
MSEATWSGEAEDRSKSSSPARRRRSVMACRECRMRKVREESKAVRQKRRKRAWTMGQGEERDYQQGSFPSSSRAGRVEHMIPSTSSILSPTQHLPHIRHAPHSSWPGVEHLSRPSYSSSPSSWSLPTQSSVPRPNEAMRPLDTRSEPSVECEMPIITVICDGDMRCHLVSEECRTLLGFVPEAITSLYDIVHAGESSVLARICLDLLPPSTPMSPSSAGPMSRSRGSRQHPLMLLQPVPHTSFPRAINVRLRLRNGTYDYYSVQAHLGGGGALFSQVQHQQTAPQDHIIIVSLLKQGQATQFDHVFPQALMQIGKLPPPTLEHLLHRFDGGRFTTTSVFAFVQGVTASTTPPIQTHKLVQH